ncbi:hypothetical protein R5R35_013576 [Gryllus longicercus]|uniref:Sulfotransferase domain-containing protein n=1 Tax=Gryllus longicercus TaxID=2509291 RepID=A0AAN9VXR6_9ORTH
MTRRMSACCAFLIGAACALTMFLTFHMLPDPASDQSGDGPLFELYHPVPANDANCTNNELDHDDSSIVIPFVNRIREIQDVISEQRLLIAKEMKGYKYPGGQHNKTAKSFQDLAPELGGKPIRTLVVTTWRSGSTFLGDVLNSHPANFYHYEPLLNYETTQIREEPLASEAVSKLKALLNCNYTGFDHYLTYGQRHIELFVHNTRLWAQCKKHRDLCWSPDFLSPFCRLFPFQSMKVVRLRLKLVEEFLKDPSLNVRVLLLVRDPRGTVQSRKHRVWCLNNPDCADPALLCSDLVADYSAAVELNAKYPNRFRVVRYEDLSVEPYTGVQDLFDFLGLDFHPRVKHFLDTHTKVNAGGVSNTYRDSKSAPFHWRQDLSHQEVRNIQRVCLPAMQHWGYVLAANSTHQHDFNPLGSFSLTLT